MAKAGRKSHAWHQAQRDLRLAREEKNRKLIERLNAYADYDFPDPELTRWEILEVYWIDFLIAIDGWNKENPLAEPKKEPSQVEFWKWFTDHYITKRPNQAA